MINEKLTDRSRKVMVLANTEAQQRNSEVIRIEHILLALLKEGGGTATAVLRNLGVDLHKLRGEVERYAGTGPQNMVANAGSPPSSETKRVIEFAIEEAQFLNQSHVDTGHILLGLIRENSGISGQALYEFGVTLAEAREQLSSIIGGIESLPVSEANFADLPLLEVLIDPGTATREELGELFFELSTLYRMIGGTGITFALSEVREPQFA